MPGEHPQVPQAEVGTRLQEPMNDRHSSSWLLAMVTPSETPPPANPLRVRPRDLGLVLTSGPDLEGSPQGENWLPF